MQALAILRKAYSVATDAEDRVTAAIQEARLTVQLGGSRLEAARRIGRELSSVTEPRVRGQVFKAIAEMYDSGDDKDPESQLLMLEAAVQGHRQSHRRPDSILMENDQAKAILGARMEEFGCAWIVWSY